MPEKYRWTFTLTWAVEYVRKDAEIAFDLDGQRFQKVIAKGCSSSEAAEKVAVDYCTKLAAQITDGIKRGVAALPDAQE